MTDKQKNILEMTKDICRVKHNCNDPCNPISACDALKYAERAYEEGYRKQKKGKWVNHWSKVFECSYPVCSECGERAPHQREWNYCPYCGAKMKGAGNE